MFTEPDVGKHLLQVHLGGDAARSNAAIAQPNVVVCRSILHIVDTVLLPISVADLAAGRSAAAPPPTPSRAPSAHYTATGLSRFRSRRQVSFILGLESRFQEDGNDHHLAFHHLAAKSGCVAYFKPCVRKALGVMMHKFGV